jgi:hypothetical protein
MLKIEAEFKFVPAFAILRGHAVSLKRIEVRGNLNAIRG